MSETQDTPSACEQLLDYVYGELDEAQRRAFEAHLATCATCQAEAASFGRVRAAMGRMLPSVEPTDKLGGALHQQLIHQAAQRSRRGRLLAFPRKLVEHPAWAAAAMFAIVGGALVVNWSHDRAMMPAAKTEAAPAVAEPVAAAPAPPAPPSTPALAETTATATPKAAPAVAAKDEDKNDRGHTVVAVAPAEKVAARERGEAQATTKKPARHAAASSDSLAQYKEGADTRFGLTGGDDNARGGGGEPAVGRLDGPGKSGKGGYNSSAPAPSAPPPAAGATGQAVGGVLSSRAQGVARPKAKLEVAVQSPAGPSRDVEGLRKRADELTAQGRCVEAIKAYESLSRQSQYVSPQERANWAHCLKSVGDREAAQQQVDQLKADKRASNAVLQKVESEFDQPAQEERKAAKRQAAKKAKTSPAPADDAKAANEGKQAEAPAQAAPRPAKPSESKPTSAY